MQVPDGRVVAWVRADFGLELERLDAVEDGADAAALLWRGVDVEGRAFAVKLSGAGSQAAAAVPALLAARGVPGVPAPQRTREGALHSERAGRRLTVVPWLDGERALAGDLPPAGWTALGRLLAAVHATGPTPEVAEVLPVERFDPAPLVDRVRELDAHLTGLEPQDEEALAVAAAWQDSRERILELAGAVEALGATLRAETGRLVLCHADPHLGNVLDAAAPEAAGPWLLDWDDALLAPPEQDLMFFLDGGILLPFAPVTGEQQAAFFQGYGGVEVDARRLAYLRGTRALVDLVDPAEQALDVELALEDREDALQIARWVLADDGLLALALATARAIG